MSPTKDEPVIFAELARAGATLVVALVARYGLSLDPEQVAGVLVAVGVAAAAWTRAHVFSPHTVEKMKGAASGTA